jgi:flavin-dependent dehydrogenase
MSGRSTSSAAFMHYDVTVIGAGPLGLAFAAWLKQDRPETRVAVVDKRSAPGFKIGESTLLPAVGAVLSLGIKPSVMRRLFNNKFGLHFWWTGEQSSTLESHIDPGNFDETFQLERRVFETMLIEQVRRLGVDVYQGMDVSMDESDVEGEIKELHCAGPDGGSVHFRSSLVCDATGPGSVIPRALGLYRKNQVFSTNAHFAYFRQKAPFDVPHFDVTATKHVCFPEGWVWFIDLVSWEHAADEQLKKMIDHLLDIDSEDDSAYPTRFELSKEFNAPCEQFITSIGVVPRVDIDTASGLPIEERFKHYVDRYPGFKRVMDRYELIEEPYPGLPTHFSYRDLVHYSERYAGDGWLAVGDAAFFVNPFLSPGMTYGFAVTAVAAKAAVQALTNGDVSYSAFAAYDQTARDTYRALIAENEMFYRCFRHPVSYEKPFLLKGSFSVLTGRFARVLSLLEGPERLMPRMRPPNPAAPGGITDPRYLDVVNSIVEVTRAGEAAGDDPAETARRVDAIVEPRLDLVRAMDGFAELRVGRAFENFDDNFVRVDHKDVWRPLIERWRCANCANDTPVEFDTCYACGQTRAEQTQAGAAVS